MYFDHIHFPALSLDPQRSTFYHALSTHSQLQVYLSAFYNPPNPIHAILLLTGFGFPLEIIYCFAVVLCGFCNLWLKQSFLSPLLHWSLSFRVCVCVWCRCPVYGWALHKKNSLSEFYQLLVSVLIIVHCTKRFADEVWKLHSFVSTEIQI